MTKIVNTELRDDKAGFRQNRSCSDQIATLHMITEHRVEYITFFDSLDRETLWKLLRHYGILEKVTNLIKKTYENMTCRVIHEGQLTEPLKIRQEYDKAVPFALSFPASCRLDNENNNSRYKN
jgi:hypothetical protein